MKKKLTAILVLLILFTQVLQTFGAASDTVEDFSDVKPTDWYYNDLRASRAAGYVEGIGNNKFSPNTIITNAEYLAITARITNPSIDDTPNTVPWTAKYIDFSESNGIIAKNETVSPNVGIPRQDMIKYTVRALGIEPYIGNEILFNDVSPEDAAYINAAYNNYLTDGVKLPTSKTPGTFGWNTTANRSQLAAMANRLAEYKKDPVAFKTKRVAERAAAQQKAEQPQGTYITWNGYKIPKDFTYYDKNSGSDFYGFVRWQLEPSGFDTMQSILSSKWDSAIVKQAIDYGKTKQEGDNLPYKYFYANGCRISVRSAPNSINVDFEINKIESAHFARWETNPEDFDAIEKILSSKIGASEAKKAVAYGRTKKKSKYVYSDSFDGNGYSVFVHSEPNDDMYVVFEIRK